MKLQVGLTLALAGLVGVLGASSANAAISRGSSSRPLLGNIASPDPFAALPTLPPPPVLDQLRVIEERASKAADCVALCELAAGIDAHPFGVASAEPPNRSEDAWGNYRFTSELETSHNRFGFTGHYWDKEASLYYAKARYYDPFTARFTQADSFLGAIDDPPSLHRYQYANANPTMFVDPTGNYSWNEFKEGAGWCKDAAGAFGRDIAANAGTRLGNIGQATLDQAKALPGAAVDAAQETAARVYDVGVLASGSSSSLRSRVGQRSVQAMAEGRDMASVTQSVGIEQGELALNILTGGGYNVGKESYLALQGTAEQAEVRLNQAAGSAVLAATIGGAVKAAPVVITEGRALVATARARLAPPPAHVVSAEFIGPRIGRSGFITSREFAGASYERYQAAVDAGYSRAAAAESRGLLRGNANTRVGDFVDRFSAQQYRNWLASEGIEEGPRAMVQMNRWLRDPAGSGRYVRPDIRVPGAIFDATVGVKLPSSTQITRFRAYSGGDRVTIVRPEVLGGSYSIR